ncbi:MAG TPA: heme NO-binding domain-containing protein [Longimicrobium sp.]
MHGIVMNQFRQFVVERLGRDGWRELAEAAGVPPEPFEIGRIYPDQALGALVAEASRRTGEEADALVEAFGVFIAPALLRVYEPLVDPAWRTLDVIEHTEAVIHTVVRARMPGAAPPLLDTRREAPDRVVIDYRSPRRLCALATGIARGLALHFGETVEIGQAECMHAGDPRCLITVRRTAGAPDGFVPAPLARPHADADAAEG